MSTIGPSLEDLLPGKQKGDDSGEEVAGEELQDKISEITIKEKEGETEATANQLGLSYFNLVGFPISPDALGTISRQQSKELKVVCFFNNGHEIRLGAVELTEPVKELSEEIKEKFHANIGLYLISQHSLEKATKLYDSLPEVKKAVAGVEIKEADLKKFESEINSFKDLNDKIQRTSITELVTLVVAGAITSRASDIHVEAEEKGIKVRYRIDGVLNDVAELQKETWPKVISRVKQLAKLKINIADQPQDGRFSIFMTEDRIDVRVSTIPTAFGESIVMRLLMSSASQLSFENLGLRGSAYNILKREIERPNGMIITTGPTGSGKTTTLYAILKQLNQQETKIVTLEDPIEYELKGINQSQVSKDYTFAKGLRSIVRQDPDIIMVGEIRDKETAETAIQAALTGHLVLSTIHTNDAFGTIPRFMSLEAKPFLLAPALNVVIGQRLVRRICDNCKENDTLDAEIMERVKKALTELPESEKEKINIDSPKFYRSAGCDKCQGLGYYGRIGIYEIMPIGGEIEKSVVKENISEEEIREIAKKNGVITMVQDGILKAMDGITTIEEVFRVTE